jgi:solute carrier family 25 phosphate transporter 3
MTTGADVHNMSYYRKCMMGGILSCGLTHAALTPLDIVKCRKQVSVALWADTYRSIPRCTRALEME